MKNRFLSILSDLNYPSKSLIRSSVPTRKYLTTPSKAKSYATSNVILKWDDATAEQLLFMQDVFDLHEKWAKSTGKTYVKDIPLNELEIVEGTRKLKKEAAQAFKKLLLAARTDIQKEGVNVAI
ncbi:MAG: hypothetical protein AAF599_02970, partial [Bacteroidota bacterium]